MNKRVTRASRMNRNPKIFKSSPTSRSGTLAPALNGFGLIYIWGGRFGEGRVDTFNPPLLARMVVARKGALPRALQMVGPLAGRSRSPELLNGASAPNWRRRCRTRIDGTGFSEKEKGTQKGSTTQGPTGQEQKSGLTSQRHFCPQLAKRDSGLGSTAPASWRKKGEPKRVRRPEGRRTIYGRGVVLPARRVRGRTLASRLVLSVVAGEGKALRLLLWGPTLAVVGGARHCSFAP